MSRGEGRGMNAVQPVRVAGIDVGSNSFLLCVLEVGDTERLVADRTDIVKLGEGVDRTRRLAPAARARALAKLAEYRRLCDELGVMACRAVGTAALRDAADRDSWLAEVAAATGIRIEVISGEREAELTYRDVAQTHGRPGEVLNLLDIGGGSSELVTGCDGVVHARRSLNIGSRRAHERAALGDPVSPADLARLRAVCDDALAGVEPVPGELVGSGGTITTLAAVQLGLTRWDAARVAATRLDRAAVGEVVERLAALPLAARRELPGLEPERADIIVAGAVLVERWLLRLEADSFGLSTGGLRLAVAREALADVRS